MNWFKRLFSGYRESGYWEKVTYNEDGEEIYREDSTGKWSKRVVNNVGEIVIVRNYSKYKEPDDDSCIKLSFDQIEYIYDYLVEKEKVNDIRLLQTKIPGLSFNLRMECDLEVDGKMSIVQLDLSEYDKI